MEKQRILLMCVFYKYGMHIMSFPVRSATGTALLIRPFQLSLRVFFHLLLLPRLDTHRFPDLKSPGTGSILQSLLSEDYIGPARDSMKMMNQNLLDDSLQSFAAELEDSRLLESDSFPDPN